RLVVQQFPEAVEPDVALADVDVPVSLAPERDGRVVAVAGAAALRRDGAGELIQCRPHLVGAGVVVARSIDMGGRHRDTPRGRVPHGAVLVSSAGSWGWGWRDSSGTSRATSPA